jgi:hypothetical protein
MNCDQFIPNYEFGSAFERLRAGAHARRCRNCAATRDWLSQVRGQLRDGTELTDFHRRVWDQAATEDAPQLIRHRMHRPQWALAAGLAIAALLLMALVLSFSLDDGRGSGRVAQPPSPRSTPAVQTRSLQIPAEEIAQLETGLDQIAANLDRLEEEAARLEARRALGELVSQLRPLDPGDST